MNIKRYDSEKMNNLLKCFMPRVISVSKRLVNMEARPKVLKRNVEI